LVIGAKGALYGTTDLGGVSNLGTVFAVAPGTETGAPWKETVLHSFSGPDGQNPEQSLAVGKNGSALWRGPVRRDRGCGFSINTSGQRRRRLDYNRAL